MSSILIGSLLLSFILPRSIVPIVSTSTQSTLYTPLNEQKWVAIKSLDKETIIGIIKQKSAQYGVDPIIPIAIVEAESRYVVNARGDNGLARGLAQIRSDFHPDITDAQADDPYFAIEFLVSNLALGHCSWWSSYPSHFCPIKVE